MGKDVNICRHLGKCDCKSQKAGLPSQETNIKYQMTNRKELLKWELETKSILNELNWKLTKAERALYLHQTTLEECKEKLQTNQQRLEETRMALQFLSYNHPLRAKCEDELYKTEISIFRLENKLKKFSTLKLIQLEIKKEVLIQEIKYYEGVLKSVTNLPNPPVVFRRVLNIPDGEVRRNSLPDEGDIFILRLKQEAIDVRNLFLSVG